MSEQRKITVEKDNQVWQEYDREVRIDLWHNRNEVTPMRLSPDEARTLLALLQTFLQEYK